VVEGVDAPDLGSRKARTLVKVLALARGAPVPADAVIEALAAYQNKDGGFGKGLEVDISAPDSNPFATELALLVCVQDSIDRASQLVQRTVQYLEDTQDAEGNWRFSEAVLQHELAPWFAGWEWPAIAPQASIVGLLRELGIIAPRVYERVDALFDRLSTPFDLLGDQYYLVRPYAYYFMAPSQHPHRALYLSGVVWWLIRQDAEGKLPDAGHFFEFVRTPDSDVGRRLPTELVGAQLDTLTTEQSEDGGWPSPYNAAWRPWVTVQNLITLQNFGRV